VLPPPSPPPPPPGAQGPYPYPYPSGSAPPGSAYPGGPPPGYPPGYPPPGYPQGYPPPGYPQGYPPPGYPQAYPYPYPPPPGYPYSVTPPPTPPPAPSEIPDEGQTLPAGYHRVTRMRSALTVTGSILFGAPYMFSLTAALTSDNSADRYLLLPVVGPLLDASSRPSCASNSDCRVVRNALAFDAILQGTGALLLAIGIASPTRVFVRDTGAASGAAPVSVALAPVMLGRSTGGLGAFGTFLRGAPGGGAPAYPRQRAGTGPPAPHPGSAVRA
jgi:hypothetical protein